MAFEALPNELVLLIAVKLCIKDVNSLLQANRGLECLLTPVLYDRLSPPPHEPVGCPYRFEDRPLCQRVLERASKCGHERPVNHLLTRGATIASDWYKGKETPLHLAARYGKSGVIAIFLQREPEASMKVFTGAQSGYWLLEQAAVLGRRDIVELMIPYVPTDFIFPAFSSAVRLGNLPIVELLLHHVDRTSLNGVLNRAATSGHSGIVELLIPQVHARYLFPTLNMAVEHEQLLIVEILLHHVDCTNLNEALKRAVTHGQTAIAALLISRIPTALRSPTATNALQAAIKNGHEDILQLLLTAGCNINANRNLLHWLGEFACWMSMVLDRRADRITAVLLENGADARAVDARGKTPLHMAAAHGPRISRTLYNRGGRFTEAENVHECFIHSLVRAGVDINARDNAGRTALHEAAENADDSTVRILLDLGAETTFVDARGNTALDLALQCTWNSGAKVVSMVRGHGLMLGLTQGVCRDDAG